MPVSSEENRRRARAYHAYYKNDPSYKARKCESAKRSQRQMKEDLIYYMEQYELQRNEIDRLTEIINRLIG